MLIGPSTLLIQPTLKTSDITDRHLQDPTMSTPQPPVRNQGSGDSILPWVQQTNPAPPSTSQSPNQLPPEVQQSQQPGSQPRPRQPTLTEVAQTIKPSDFLTFHQAPCSRTGLLTGIGAGAAVGAVRWIMGLPIPRAANWAVGTGALAAMGQYEYCQFRRRQEREKVKRVVEVYAAKQAQEKREKEEAGRRERERIAKEEEERGRRRESWWRVW
ncbi:cytochrome oxidase biogenesis protein, Cox20 subunit [Parathielavia hyrcaniae]|uniref:Cytochrome c oxidase assembly protein COX20, mitochondrial n=1 Tax=Parathielavia hyrcaniae TaxID=113614 RepID=A0AAN6SZ35_9PEZI|nr:cytochrome oxidase biogenesis protein, Cox20 subunit [Parathielavia hyrcaniae]